MKLVLQAKNPKADLLFLTFFKNQKLSKTQENLLGVEKKAIEARLKAKDFEGDEGQTLTLFLDTGNFKRVVLIGRGKKEKQLPQATEFLGGKMAALAKNAKAKTVAIHSESHDLNELANGFVLGNYEFMGYRKKDPKSVSIETVQFVCEDTKSNRETLKRADVFQTASIVTRDLINTCAGNQDTETFAKQVVEIAKKNKIKTTVLDDKKLQKIGCGGLYGMGQGAKIGSRMVLLEYRYKSTAKNPDIAFIGKGIVFDTGGMNFKPSAYIDTMKLDMSGAATTLSALCALSDLKVKGYFLGVLCIAENALSDRSIHTGDVVTMYNGKTVEVNNTDAEGRVVLADGLAYAEKHFKPKKMVDIATLTGGVVIALGYVITAILGNDDSFIQEVLDSGKVAKERQWPLPLDEDFVKACKGDFSDLMNATDGIRASTIMGAAFLKHFVEKTPWVHIDFAGTAWAEKPTPTTKYGATAAGLRTLIELGIQNGKA